MNGEQLLEEFNNSLEIERIVMGLLNMDPYNLNLSAGAFKDGSFSVIEVDARTHHMKKGYSSYLDKGVLKIIGRAIVESKWHILKEAARLAEENTNSVREKIKENLGLL